VPAWIPGRTQDSPDRPAPLRLGSRLLGIILLAVLPALGLLLYTSLELRRSAVAQVKSEALRLATVAGENEVRVIEGSRELLTALANLPEIRFHREPACGRILADLLRGNPSYLNLGVTDSNGQIICSALPIRGPVDASHRAWFLRAWSTREFAVGDYQIGRITRKPSLNVGYPVRAADGSPVGVLFAAIDLRTFYHLADRLELPDGASLSVVDGSGVVLAHYPDSGPWVGRSSPGEPATARALTIRRGVFEATGPDGVPRLYGCAPLPMGGGYVTVGVPKAAALRDARRVFQRALAGLFAVALLAFFASWLVGRRLLVRPVTETVAEKEARLRAILEHSSNLFYSHTPDHVLTYVSPQARSYFDCEPEEALRRWTEFVTDNPINREGYEATQRAIETGRRQPRYELELRTRTGRILWVEVDEAPVVVNGRTVAIVGALSDVSARKLAERERGRLEEQLRHSQKMEAVGRLAGGVAHDFNNLLTAILGYADLIARQARPGDAVRRHTDEIVKATTRASMLTRQLLAFSRRDMLLPRVLDLNALVEDLVSMLQRLVGDDIEMKVVPSAGRPAVEADPGQLELVIMNLVVNARDAMPQGGRITVETTNVDIDEGYAGENLGMKAGPYVLLAVSDTGIGMDEATKARIFEPFFTTKEPGKGTGLGLSTVYGIVLQSGGAVHVYSHAGWGTTFKIYLPCAAGPVDATRSAGTLEDAPRGSETVLVVEDQDAVAQVMRAALESRGYRVLESRHGLDAIATCDAFEGPIHLLLSDVVLPMISGPELAERVRATRPDIRVLYVSGYTEGIFSDQEASDGSGAGFLQKPFTPGALAWKVREVLDGTAARMA
jgi:PAS domain S-box-containing protein